MFPVRSQDKPHVCEHCMEQFWSSRYDAKFCSPRCRKRSERDAKRVTERGKALKRDLEAYVAQFAQDNKLTRKSAVKYLYLISTAAHAAAFAWEE